VSITHKLYMLEGRSNSILCFWVWLLQNKMLF